MSKSKVKGQGHYRQKNWVGLLADISGIAELICDKFTRKTCLVPRSDEFEGQGQFRRPACGLCFVNIFALVYNVICLNRVIFYSRLTYAVSQILSLVVMNITIYDLHDGDWLEFTQFVVDHVTVIAWPPLFSPTDE